MSHYGVRRVIVLNSGGFVYAELDLSKPVHLVAPNNRGKSTLVNALQFLYVDDMSKMAFGRRTVEDTRRHYFGHDPSYLVFECSTPAGIQCLLVRGLGHLRSYGFERYVFQREYQREDFQDEHRRLVSFEVLRGRLANRKLLEVPAKQHYWEVLSGQVSSESKDIPRLSILPLKKAEDYRSFREVFVSLLKLSNIDGRSLQDLVIACHAREITESRIDIAAQYKAEFERAERAEQDVAFIRAVREEIDQGSKLRTDEGVILGQLAQTGPKVICAARQSLVGLGTHQAQLASQIIKQNQAKAAKDQEQRKCDKEAGVWEERLRVAQDAVDLLEKEHQRWGAYTPLQLQSLRDKIDDLELRMSQLKQGLQRNLDPAVLKGQVENLTRKVQQDKKALEHWDKTAFTVLREAGMTEPRLLSVFRVLNPGLLNLIVGQSLTIKDQNALLANLDAIRERVKRNTYADASVEAHLESVGGPDLVSIKSQERLRGQIKITEQNLAQAVDQLKIAEDQVQAQKELDQKTAEHKLARQELTGYEQHLEAWQKRAQGDGRVKEADTKLAGATAAAAQVRQEIETMASQTRQLQEQVGDVKECIDQLKGHLRMLSDLMAEVGLEIPLLSEESATRDGWPVDTIAALKKESEDIGKQLSNLSTQARKVRPLREKLGGIEDAIKQKSTKFGTQQVFFADREEEWKTLVDKRESLDKLDQVSVTLWNDLFATLGARLNGIRLGMRSIEQAVTRINGGLKRFRVSNLREVQLKVEKSPDAYSMVEALTSQDSIFQNRDEIEAAKDRLRIMIQSAQPIELRTLFALHIRVQQNDGQWMEAKSLDEIGSTGTGMTAKSMIFIQLVRAIIGNERYRLHFYMDETGHLDDQNLHATTAMAMSKGIMPITAEPDVRIDPLAHPEVTVYALGQNSQGRFFIEGVNTYRAARIGSEAAAPVEAGHE